MQNDLQTIDVPADVSIDDRSDENKNIDDRNENKNTSHQNTNQPVAKQRRRSVNIKIPPMIYDTISIRELDLNMIRPNTESIKTNLGGTKLTVIGKPGSGKSVLIKALLASKQHIIPIGMVISGSEDTNRFYKSMFPNAFIFESFNMSHIENIQKRQKPAKQHLPNPWAVLIMDDCMDDVKIFNDPKMIGLMKNSRHWSLLTIISTQYCLDFKPVIRTNMDGIFIFRDPNMTNREKLYRNFASIIPNFQLFNKIMDDITDDYYCLYIHNQSASNNWQECCFYYKAPQIENLKFGCDEFWKFSDTRCLTNVS
jgi:hypothetical protein